MNNIFENVPTLKRLFEGLHFIHYRSKPYGKTTRICFIYEIPNKTADAKGANFAKMYITHFREKIDLYRRKVPRRNENVVKMYYNNVEINADRCSCYCVARDVIVMSLTMDVYFSNAKQQRADDNMEPYDI